VSSSRIFKSIYMAGYECSTFRRPDGKRLDLIASTGHDANAIHDYRQDREHGIRSARDGFRWHLIETSAGKYDWSSFLPMFRAARQEGIQVIWDLCHYGYPDDVDVWSNQFVDRFAGFAAAAARLVRDESDETPFYCPINELSFWAWAGAEVAEFNPSHKGMGRELKRQLVRAALAGTAAIREVDPRARIIYCEPAIHVRTKWEQDPEHDAAEAYRLAQYEAYDMLLGRLSPELGGQPGTIDMLGVNYYSFNQWYYGGGFIPMGHHHYRPFSDMLEEIHKRYDLPMFVAETGAEGTPRPAWLHYISGEVREAIARGVPVHGICLYPVTNYLGWENDRLCEVGLFREYRGSPGPREMVKLFADELRRQQSIFGETASSSAELSPGQLKLASSRG
jgi:beta-glucosidase/6-phospho-beta-glucosidase/beta-galactosidase